MSTSRLIVLSLFVALIACDEPPAAEAVAIETEEQKILYALGQGIARQLTLVGLFSEEEMASVGRGFVDAAVGHDSLVALDEYGEKMNAMFTQRRADKNQQWGAEFREVAAAWEGAVTTESGLIYQSVVEGTGVSPSAEQTVTVNYTGRFIDGRVFDTSAKREAPATFRLDAVIPGWTEGLQLMKVGGRARMVVPPQLAYGEKGEPPRMPPNATLIFEIELLAFK